MVDNSEGRREIILVLGGAASGKSLFAESLACGAESAAYLATAVQVDDEMNHKIAAHKARRPASWQTIEVGHQNIASVFMELDVELIFFDSLTLYVAKAVESLGDSARDHFEALLDNIRGYEKRLIIVSDEVGSGLVPATRNGRRFRETLGRVNAEIAAVADTAYFVTAGLPLLLKGGDAAAGVRT